MNQIDKFMKPFLGNKVVAQTQPNKPQLKSKSPGVIF